MNNQLCYILLFILLGACGSNSDAPSLQTKQEQKTSNPLPDYHFSLDSAVLGSMKKYYQQNFGKGNLLKETNLDSVINLSYYDSTDYDENSFVLMHVDIPVKNTSGTYNEGLILKGDLNNDQQIDLIVSVYTAGGGGGGNVESVDTFIFLFENGKFKLVNVATDGSACGCTGSFSADKIENNLIVGHSVCYADTDDHCCPSLQYEVKLALENDTLKCVSRTKMN